MCRHCGDGGCAYCEGWFLSEEEVERNKQGRVKPLTQREINVRLQHKNQLDYELLQLQKQDHHFVI